MMSNLTPIPDVEGWSALIVEDEALIAAALEGLLAELGATRIGWACTAEDADRLVAAGSYSLAVVDWFLGRQTSAGLVERLGAEGMGVLVLSGAGRDEVVVGEHVRWTFLGKPAVDGDVARAVAELLTKR